MRYFFVFQNKTYNEEYRGGYLWAPQYGSSGKRVSHWEKMKSVRRGDVIIHSYEKRIVAISIAKQDVYEAKRPRELSDEWQQEGWKVDCEYMPFENTIITSDYMETLLKIQPKKDAPFNRLGRGNTGYLFDANEEMYKFLLKNIAEAQKNEKERKRVYGLLKSNVEEQKSLTELEIEMDIEEIEAKCLSRESLAEHIRNADRPKKSQKSETTVYYRNPYIKEMAKLLAEGKCQMCGKEAPFYDKADKPYLEVHHIKRLADGGSDTIENVVAICPNCHRKMHVLNKEEDVSMLVRVGEQNERQCQRYLAYDKKVK